MCVTCRKPLLPGGNNVAFGTAGQVLFGAHEGKCADTVRELAGGAVQVTRAVLKARAPKLFEGLQLAGEAFRRITQGEDHGTERRS